MTLYDVIVSDPPWDFKGNSEAKPGRNARGHYPCMPIEDILALPVGQWAAKQAVLYLWTTAPFLDLGLATLKVWGFQYKSMFVWDKERTATGYWNRNEHEIVLIGRKGRFPPPAPEHRIGSVLRGQRREHSRKPDSLYAHLDAAYPDAVKLDMFSRETRPGWHQFGNEIDKFDDAAAIEAMLE